MSPNERIKIQNATNSVEQAVIRQFELSPDDIARIRTLDPSDPVTDYAGNIIVQAQMIADERSKVDIPENIILGAD